MDLLLEQLLRAARPCPALPSSLALLFQPVLLADRMPLGGPTPETPGFIAGMSLMDHAGQASLQTGALGENCAIVPCRWPYNFELFLDGTKILNQKGWRVCVYTVCSTQLIPTEAALELGRNIQAKVNADPNNNTTLHLDCNRFFVSQEARYNDFLRQEKRMSS